MGTIYKIENTVNGKVYVRQTTNWRLREKDHRSRLKRCKHHNEHLQNSWNKYGESAFTFTVLVDDLPERYMDDVEQGLIATLRAMDKKHGYNKQSGGQITRRHSEDTKKKISEGLIKRSLSSDYTNPMTGKKMTEEEKLNRSKACKGKNPRSVSCICTDILTGESTIYTSYAACGEAIGAHKRYVKKVADDKITLYRRYKIKKLAA